MSLSTEPAPLRFHPLTFLEEKDGVVVGRPDIDAYAVLPHDGAALLRTLQAGTSPAAAASWFGQRFGEPVDIDDFVSTLRELAFVRDDAYDGGPDDTEPGRPVRWQRLGRAVFSPAAWFAYAALVLAALLVTVADPAYAPRHEHVFFVDYFVVVELTLFALQMPLILLHELFHVLAGRRLGLRSRVRLSQRWYFLVFETALDGLVAVPRGKRYLPMLAGLLADVVVMAVLTLTAYLTREPDGPTFLGRLCLALAFTTLPRIAWQFYFFLRTDIYYLVTTVLGCVDLQTTTRQLLANRVNRLLGRRDRLVPEHLWHPRDRAVARWYAPLLVTGYALSLVVLVTVMLPLAWQFFGQAVSRVFLDEAGTSAQVWDSALLLALNLSQVVLAGVLALRARRRTRPAPHVPRHARSTR